MSTFAPQSMARLRTDLAARRIHLNTGEYMTLFMVASIAWAEESRIVDRTAVYDASPLSKGSINSHFRSLEQRGLITRTPHDVFFHL